MPPATAPFAERPGYFVSVGLHPWRADRYTETQIAERLSHFLADRSVVAVGEIGLDRVKGPDFSLQQKVFEQQWQLAQAADKPVIIHCVRAYSDLAPYAKTSTVPLVLHNYSGNAETTAQFLRFPNVYFSLGRLLFRNPKTAAERLAQIPTARLFLETDTTPVSIETLYKTAAGFLQTDSETLALACWNNFVSLTGLGART